MLLRGATANAVCPDPLVRWRVTVRQAVVPGARRCSVRYWPATGAPLLVRIVAIRTPGRPARTVPRMDVGRRTTLSVDAAERAAATVLLAGTSARIGSRATVLLRTVNDATPEAELVVVATVRQPLALV